MRRINGVLAILVLLAVAARAEQPSHLAVLPEDESVYAPPTPSRADEGVNAGGVNVDFAIRLMTDYVYRGIDHSEVGGSEDTPNHQFDTKLSFDFGKAPHPYVGLFANVYNSDPVSRFQEIRPTLGVDWTIKPLILSGGFTSYILPEREVANTAEVFGRLQFDDSFLFLTEKPVLSPYILGAYDYDQNKGWYIEVGVRQERQVADTNLMVALQADVAYVIANQQFANGGKTDTGFQHYDLSLTATYPLNTLINLSKRYGEISLQGYVTYTDGIYNALHADTQIWGGMGIVFHY